MLAVSTGDPLYVEDRTLLGRRPPANGPNVPAALVKSADPDGDR